MFAFHKLQKNLKFSNLTDIKFFKNLTMTLKKCQSLRNKGFKKCKKIWGRDSSFCLPISTAPSALELFSSQGFSKLFWSCGFDLWEFMDIIKVLSQKQGNIDGHKCSKLLVALYVIGFEQTSIEFYGLIYLLSIYLASSNVHTHFD